MQHHRYSLYGERARDRATAGYLRAALKSENIGLGLPCRIVEQIIARGMVSRLIQHRQALAAQTRQTWRGDFPKRWHPAEEKASPVATHLPRSTIRVGVVELLRCLMSFL